VKRFGPPLAIAAAVVAVILLVLTGGDSSSSLPSDPMTGKTEFDIAVQDPVLVAEGEVLYQSNCAACHGADLRGTAVGPSHLSIIYNPDHHGDGAFAGAALAGVGAHHWRFGDMPPVQGITEDGLVRIIAFIREAQRTEGFEAFPPE
jgi:mono/diheme cytochrome c family protein